MGSRIWPKLPASVAIAEFAKIGPTSLLEPATSVSAQYFGPIGTRSSVKELEKLRLSVVSIAAEFGFPLTAIAEQRVAFDQSAAVSIRQTMSMTWAEASNAGVWNFVALILMPDVTRWRFPGDNRERWIASDLTRHTWARLWWRGEIFASEPGLLAALRESDLNQLLERRSIGGEPRLVCAMARAVLEAEVGDAGRRLLIRQSTARLQRVLAFVDPMALPEQALQRMCFDLVAEVRKAIGI